MCHHCDSWDRVLHPERYESDEPWIPLPDDIPEDMERAAKAHWNQLDTKDRWDELPFEDRETLLVQMEAALTAAQSQESPTIVGMAANLAEMRRELDEARAEANELEGALKAICGPEDRGYWIEEHYRPAGGGYQGLQAIARAALGET